jgi:tRNA1(Val) A37 N6-methylase TrmN6
VPAKSGETALELGAGAGTASLCLWARVRDVRVTGIEIEESLAALARDNAKGNGASCRFVAADIFDLPAEYKRGFDQVFCNPPFHGEGLAPTDARRALALHDAQDRLADWLKLGLQRTVSGGCFTAILRADRLNEALAALPERGVSAFALWPRAGDVPKRVIVQARQGSRAPFALLPGLVLHQGDGSWTDEAEAVLRRGNALALSGARL